MLGLHCTDFCLANHTTIVVQQFWGFWEGVTNCCMIVVSLLYDLQILKSVHLWFATQKSVPKQKLATSRHVEMLQRSTTCCMRLIAEISPVESTYSNHTAIIQHLAWFFHIYFYFYLLNITSFQQTHIVRVFAVGKVEIAMQQTEIQLRGMHHCLSKQHWSIDWYLRKFSKEMFLKSVCGAVQGMWCRWSDAGRAVHVEVQVSLSMSMSAMLTTTCLNHVMPQTQLTTIIQQIIVGGVQERTCLQQSQQSHNMLSTNHTTNHTTNHFLWSPGTDMLITIIQHAYSLLTAISAVEVEH